MILLVFIKDEKLSYTSFKGSKSTLQTISLFLFSDLVWAVSNFQSNDPFFSFKLPTERILFFRIFIFNWSKNKNLYCRQAILGHLKLDQAA